MAGRIEPPRKPIGPSTLAVHGGEPRPKPASLSSDDGVAFGTVVRVAPKYLDAND